MKRISIAFAIVLAASAGVAYAAKGAGNNPSTAAVATRADSRVFATEWREIVRRISVGPGAYLIRAQVQATNAGGAVESLECHVHGTTAAAGIDVDLGYGISVIPIGTNDQLTVETGATAGEPVTIGLACKTSSPNAVTLPMDTHAQLVVQSVSSFTVR